MHRIRRIMKTAIVPGFRKVKAVQGVLSVVPTLVILLFIRFYPIGEAIYRSFTNWNGFGKLAGRAEVVALCDIDPQARGWFRQHVPKAAEYDDFNKLLPLVLTGKMTPLDFAKQVDKDKVVK